MIVRIVAGNVACMSRSESVVCVMANLLRRIRGAIGMGVIWAVAWGFVGGTPRWIFGLRADAPFGLIFGVLGFIAGVVFSVVLVLAEGRRRFDQMSIRRFAGWGAVGGVLLAGIFSRMASLGVGDVLLITPTFMVACAACASGSLALARRAERREWPGHVEREAIHEGLEP